jgi:hypothetical protein
LVAGLSTDIQHMLQPMPLIPRSST